MDSLLNVSLPLDWAKPTPNSKGATFAAFIIKVFKYAFTATLPPCVTKAASALTALAPPKVDAAKAITLLGDVTAAPA